MKNNFIQILALSAVLTICIAPVSAEAESARTRLKTAEAMFQERCKTAGEKIYKTVDNVESVFLMKLRPKKKNFNDQYLMDDPYGMDVTGEGYIASFLMGRNARGSLAQEDGVTGGYRYVEAVDPQDSSRYRYMGRVDEPWRYDNSYSKTYKRFVLDRVPTTGPMPRYGVTYDDISTQKDREYWIAGGSLKVIDIQTKEIIAERIGYMMDRGQGNTSGERSPWLLAARNACPSFPVTSGGHPFKGYQTRNFVEKVLHIKEKK